MAQKRQAIQDNESIIIKWLWLDNHNKWRHFSDELSHKIETLQVNQSMTITENNRRYKINKTDTSTATQTNIVSKKVRSMKRITRKHHKKDSIISWCWLDNYNKWRPFDDSTSNQIESMSLNSTIDIIIKGRKYQILKKNTINDVSQYNMKTNTQRALKRVIKYCKQKPVWQYEGYIKGDKVWTDLPLSTCVDIDNLAIGESLKYRVGRNSDVVVVKISHTRCEQTRSRNRRKSKRILRKVGSNSMDVDDVKDTNDANDEEMDSNSMDECVVCMDKEKQYVCTPCGHLCLCLDCTKIINGKCPMCRSECQVMKVFK